MASGSSSRSIAWPSAGPPRRRTSRKFSEHPLSVAGRAVLEPRGEAEALRARTLAILTAANEDPAAFRMTSRYVVATARRAA